MCLKEQPLHKVWGESWTPSDGQVKKAADALVDHYRATRHKVHNEFITIENGVVKIKKDEEWLCVARAIAVMLPAVKPSFKYEFV